MKIEDAFYVGYITKTKGLKGEIQIFFEYEDSDFLEMKILYLEYNNKLVPFFISSYKLHPNGTGNFFLEDIDHIDKAQSLVKKKVYLPLSEMPDRSSDGLRYEDLEGFTVIDEAEGKLGVIIEINEYPQQFVATISINEGEVLFPLNEDLILQIDEEEKSVLVRLPEGLINIYVQP